MDIENIIFCGLKDSGKSCLMNTLLGNEEKDINSEKPKEIIEKNGQFNNSKICIIKFPELENNKENETLTSIIEYIKNKKEIKVVAIILNYLNQQFNDSLMNLIKLIDKIYPDIKWCNHLAIIWTHYSSNVQGKSEDLKEKKQKFKILFKKEIKCGISEKELNLIPHFFIDSIEARKENNITKYHLTHFIDWVKELNPIQGSLGKIVNINKVIKKREEEIIKELISKEKIDDQIFRFIYVNLKRYKLTNYSNEISYSDWEEIPNSMKTTEVRYIEKEISGEIRQVLMRTKQIKRIYGIRLYQGDIESGYYYIKKIKIQEERDIEYDNNRIPLFGEWKEVSRSKPYNYITRHYNFLDKKNK